MKILYKLGFIKASTYRTRIIKQLSSQEKTPKKLSNELNITQSNISATLSVLKKQGYVECLNPEVRKGRLYRLTDLGVLVNDML